MADFVAAPDSALALLAALRGTRVLVPVVAVADRVLDGVDKDSHMSSVEFQAADGRRALLAFTGVDALTAWDPTARPVPRQVHHAAQAVLEAQYDALILDIAGPVPVAVQGALLGRLAVAPDAALVAGALERLQAAAAGLPTVRRAHVVSDAAAHTLHLQVHGADPRLPDLVAGLLADPELALVLDLPLAVALDGDLGGQPSLG